MMRVFHANLNALLEHPFYFIIVIIWFVWYVDYHFRKLRCETNPKIIHAHKRRQLVAVFTAVTSLMIFNRICIDNQTLRNAYDNGDTLSSQPIDISPQPKTENVVAAPVGETVSDDGLIYETMQNPSYRCALSSSRISDTEYYFSIMISSLNIIKEKKEFIKNATPIKMTIESGGSFNLRKIKKGAKSIYEYACDLELLRNYPYAMHGYRFKSKKLNEFFSILPWYKPKTTDTVAIEKKFTRSEIAIIKAVVAEERSLKD